MNKAIKMLLKVVSLIAFSAAFLWLLPQCDTIPDRWFGTWLWSTIFSFVLAVFFTAWIAETLTNWNEK